MAAPEPNAPGGEPPIETPPSSGPPAEGASPETPRPLAALLHPALYIALVAWLLISLWLMPPSPAERGPSRPPKQAHGFLQSVLGNDEELDLRKALVVFPPLIVGCGLLIGYIVLRSYDIRVFPRCDFPTVPWTGWNLVRCGVLFLVVQRLLFLGIASLGGWKPAARWLAGVPPVLFEVIQSNVLMVATCGLAIALVAAGGAKPLAALGLRERYPIRRAAMGVVGYVMVIPLSFLAGILSYAIASTFDLPIHQQPVLAGAQSLSLMAYLAFGFSAVIVAPVTEEFLFRGFLYGTLRRYLGPMTAICLSAAAFAAAHAFAFGFPSLFVIGFLLAYLYERTGSLAAPIAAHAAHNLYALVALRLLQSPGFM